MILTCPDCATRYLTKPEAIGPNGRTVRCASCSATWFVPAESADEALTLAPEQLAPALAAPKPKHDPIDDFDPAPAQSTFQPPSPAGAMREKAERKRAAKRVMGVSLMWLLTLALLSAAALGVYIFRGPIVDRFPQTATLYKAFGIDVASGGLILDNVTTRSALIDGTATLLVEGSVVNPGRESYPVRMIELSLHSSGGEALTRWRVELPQKRLAPGQSAQFSTQYPNPPVDAIELKYMFAGDDVPMRGGESLPDANPSGDPQ